MAQPDREGEAVIGTIDDLGIATIAINRPDKSNAMDAGMRRQFMALVERFSAQSAVRVIVVRGEGRHFCAGSDTSGIGSASVDERVDMYVTLDACAKPTIAAIHGACLGTGLAIACCCDGVIATSDAFFAIPEVRLGIPPLALMPLFIRSMGPSQFRRYALNGQRFTASEAKDLGIVHQVVPAQELARNVALSADCFLRASPQASRTLKRAWAPFFGTPDLRSAMLKLAMEEQAIVRTDEARAGLTAARLKQDPPWYVRKS